MNNDIKREIQSLFPDYLEAKHGITIKWDEGRGRTKANFNDIFHAEANPSASLYTNNDGVIMYKCFSGENPFHGDIFAFVQRELNTSDFLTAYNYLCDFYHIDKKSYIKRDVKPGSKKQAPAPKQEEPAPEWVENYFRQCRDRMHETDYMKKRGFYPETLERYGVGYDPKPVIFNDNGTPATYDNGNIKFIKGKNTDGAIIWPYKNGFNRRMIDPQTDQQTGKPYKAFKQTLNGQPLGVWNAEVITDPATTSLYIVEGEADALTILQAGYSAVALGTAQSHILKALLKGVTYPVIVALDNDKTGRANTEKLSSELKNDGLPYVFKGQNIAGNYKDVNERLVNEGPDAIRQALDTNAEAVEKLILQAQEEKKKQYKNNFSVAGFMGNDFISTVEESDEEPTPTGFNFLDKALDGGLYAGIYTFASNSGQGKTTFVEQIAVNIASAGTSVLYFSLEMPIKDILGKILSMKTFERVRQDPTKWEYKRTAREVIAPIKYKYYTDQEKEFLKETARDFQETAGKNIYIFYRNEGFSVLDIEEAIKNHIENMNETPAVMIDYFQILNPMDPNGAGARDERIKANENIKYLKHIASRYNTPILNISAVNRQSYNERMDTSALKESANIEFNSDVILALNFAKLSAIDEYNKNARSGSKKAFDVREAMQDAPRKMEIELLKGRLGATYMTVYFDYYAKYNYFEEVETIYFEDIDAVCVSLEGITAGNKETKKTTEKQPKTQTKSETAEEW